MEILNLKIAPNFTQSYTVETKTIELGDHGRSTTLPVGKAITETWNVNTVPSTDEGSTEIKLKAIKGQEFIWNPLGVPMTWFCREWRVTSIGQDYSSTSLNLVRAQVNAVDECIAATGAIANTTPPLFPLNAFSWEFQQSVTFKRYEQRFEGGINAIQSYSYNARKHEWKVQRAIKDETRNEVHAFLKDQCGRPFNFQITPDSIAQLHECFSWQFQAMESGLWTFSATFTQNLSPYKPSPFNQLLSTFDFYNDKQSIITAVGEHFAALPSWLSSAKSFINTYTRNALPLLINLAGLMINSFHTVLGRGGYFPGGAGPTEAQAVLARAAIIAFNATGDTGWRDLAILAGDALLNNFYSLPIPSNWTPALGFRVPHWLINIKSPFPSKGAIADDPLNYGHFDLVVNFTNGIGQIPNANSGNLLANVYAIYPPGDQLLWQNVYAFPLGGYTYPIEYWVTDVMLEGVLSRQYPDSESSAGRLPTPTTEPAGLIKLSNGFTGAAIVVYSSYTGPVIPAGALFEPYPMWRELRPSEALAAFDVFPWSEDAYDLLYQSTNNNRYRVARDCTIYSEALVSTVDNPSKWFARSDALNPFAFPGSQVILANHPPGATATATRVIGGLKDQWIDIEIPSSATLYPSAEYQNFAVQIKAVEDMTVTVAVACSQATELTVNLSLARSAFDYSLYYAAHVIVNANEITTRTFAMDEFLFWDLNRTSWHPHIADDPAYKYSGDGGSAIVTKELLPIGSFNRVVSRFKLTNGGGYAGGGLVILGKPVSFPIEIFYKNTGGTARLKIVVDSRDHFYTLPATDWQLAKIGAGVFSGAPRGSAIVQKIEIIPAGSAQTDTSIWYVGFRPQTLQLPIQTYKASIVSKLTTAHTLSIGTFEAAGSPSSQLTYNPGAVPFTCNVVSDGSGGQSIDSWRGAPYSGYQYPAWYVKMGYWSRLDQCLDFLLEAQVQYALQNENGTNGPFMPVFYWGYWDAGELSPNGVDVWSYSGSDPNTQWCGYFSRPVESVAHAWQRLVANEYPGFAPINKASLIAKCAKITMQYLWWLSSFYTRNNSVQPPTNFPPKVDPIASYNEPHQAAFYLRTAIYANLAGGDAATTIRIIKASLDYLESQRVTTGTMAGSWSAGQPVFGSHREYFGFWHMEIVEAIALLESKKTQLNYPDCIYLIRG